MVYIGKFTNYSYSEVIEKYDTVQLDMLWYILDLTKIERFVSAESFKEFLTRFFLIREKDLNEYALDIIDNELVVDGFIGDVYFSLDITDLINLIGFSKSTAKYNIKSSTEEYIDEYIFIPPNLKFAKVEGQEKTYTISQQALTYALAGLGNLLELENCSLKFRNDLQTITQSQKDGALKLAQFIVSRLPKELFEQYDKDFPMVKVEAIERLIEQDIVKFNIFKDMNQENLALIYERIVDKDTADLFRKIGEDEELKDELQWFNEQINFAYGVKHNFIKLSDHYSSLIDEVNPVFDYDYDLLLGPDSELYSTQEIYDNLKMNEWEHLLP